MTPQIGPLCSAAPVLLVNPRPWAGSACNVWLLSLTDQTLQCTVSQHVEILVNLWNCVTFAHFCKFLRTKSNFLRQKFRKKKYKKCLKFFFLKKKIFWKKIFFWIFLCAHARAYTRASRTLKFFLKLHARTHTSTRANA